MSWPGVYKLCRKIVYKGHLALLSYCKIALYGTLTEVSETLCEAVENVTGSYS